MVDEEACVSELHGQSVSLSGNLQKTSIKTAPLVTVRRLILCVHGIDILVVHVDTESTPRLSGL